MNLATLQQHYNQIKRLHFWYKIDIFIHLLMGLVCCFHPKIVAFYLVGYALFNLLNLRRIDFDGLMHFLSMLILDKKTDEAIEKFNREQG